MKFRWFPVWVGFSVLAIVAVSLTFWDPNDVRHSILGLVAAVTGLLYTMFAGRGWLSCYVYGFINAPLYAYLSYRWGYYGDMALNLYYFVLMFPGYFCWKKNLSATNAGSIVRTRLSGRDRWIWSVRIAVAVLVLWVVLRTVGGNRPFCDAVTNVFSIVAIILTVKRCIEQWVLWLAVDAIEMFMWWHTNESSFAILAMWTLFFVDGCYCFWLWLVEGGEYGKIRLEVGG